MDTTAWTALIWGLVAGGALVAGAGLGFYGHLGRQTIALFLAFGSGVLISAIAFDIMDVAYKTAGFAPATLGFVIGATLLTVIAFFIRRQGGGKRLHAASAEAADRNARVVAVGSLIDGIPEAIAIGLSFTDAKGVAFATIAAIFLSNIPEGVAASTGMKRAGHGAAYIFTVWGGISVVSGLSALFGYAVFSSFPPTVIATVQGVAGGSMIAIIADTMIPEAFHDAQEATGFVAALGFVAGFSLSHGLV